MILRFPSLNSCKFKIEVAGIALLVGLGIEEVLYRNINTHFKSVFNFFIELEGGLCSTTDIVT